jgi:hypothetical protein
MKIANPLYDHAFKYLMSNNRLAKKVLSTILDQEVLELELAQQEIVVEDKQRRFTLYRLDFKAKIRSKNGKEELVLIELQKSKLPTNKLRFRNYLGHAYTQKKTKLVADKKAKTVLLPIIAIYIMGYDLPDIPVMAVKVDRKIINASTKEVLEIDSDFIELLTHQCYILQIRRLPLKRKTRLEKFMTLFNQAWISDYNYILDLEYIPEEFKDIAEYLQRPLLDPNMIKQLEVEGQLEMVFSNQEAALEKAKNEAIKAKAQVEKERKAKEAAKAKVKKERQEKEKAKANAEKERQEKERAKANAEKERQEKRAAQIKLAKKMLRYGESVEDILAETGLDSATLDALIKENKK